MAENQENKDRQDDSVNLPLIDEWDDNQRRDSNRRVELYRKQGAFVKTQTTTGSEEYYPDYAPWDCQGGAGSGNGPPGPEIREVSITHYKIYSNGNRLPERLPEEPPLLSECFVATAVYQNPHAEQVEQYRWLRENVLKRTTSGNKFVRWYENGGGQRLSYMVNAHPTLRIPSMFILDIGALAIKGARNLEGIL